MVPTATQVVVEAHEMSARTACSKAGRLEKTAHRWPPSVDSMTSGVSGLAELAPATQQVEAETQSTELNSQTLDSGGGAKSAQDFPPSSDTAISGPSRGCPSPTIMQVEVVGQEIPLTTANTEGMPL